MPKRRDVSRGKDRILEQPVPRSARPTHRQEEPRRELAQPARERGAAPPARVGEVVKQPVSQLPAGYGRFLNALKARIRTAQAKAARSASRELIRLYWDIGKGIAERQEKQRWGQSVVERLSADLRRAFPEMRGFSPRNLWDMRRFYQSCCGRPILRQLVAEIPWGHNLVLLYGVEDAAEREWYAQQAIEHGWSRNVLSLQIETDLYGRKGKAVTNFRRTLPPPQSDLAEQALKDPYVFDFLTLDTEAREREIERGLLGHIREFLLELGVGFAFVGQQVHLEVGDEDFYLDLLFYHLRLRCFVVIDLKAKPFTPEDAGKMNFYLSAADDRLRHPDDGPSVGLILCKPKASHRLVAEYALRDMSKPIGVSQYQLTRALPRDLESSLPTIEELEAELSGMEGSPPSASCRRRAKAKARTPKKGRRAP